jgi:hypothetical protein
MAKQLGPGDPFPSYNVLTARSGRVILPTDLKAEYAVIIFYRGVW